MAERGYQNQARVYVAGHELMDVYECFYSVRTEKARSGIATENARPHRIWITRRSEAETPGFEWAHDSRPDKFQSGKIEFYDKDGKVMKTFEWTNGYVVHYREGVPDLQDAERSTMMEEYEIAAEEFTCGSDVLSGYWGKR